MKTEFRDLAKYRIEKSKETIMDARQEGDYKDFVEFNKGDIEDWLNKAEGFIDVIDKLVKERLRRL